jgi:hypothetical protein
MFELKTKRVFWKGERWWGTPTTADEMRMEDRFNLEANKITRDKLELKSRRHILK